MTNEVHIVMAYESDTAVPVRAFTDKAKAEAFLKLCRDYDTLEPKLLPFKRGQYVDSKLIYATHNSNRRSWERGHPAGAENAYSSLIIKSVPFDVD